MKKYAVLIDKILFLIFPGVGREVPMSEIYSEIPPSSYAIAVRASQRADFSAVCFGADGETMKEPHFCLAALSFFFKEIRGLPSQEVEIEFLGSVYSLDMSIDYTPGFRKMLQKSKLKLAKTIVMQDKTEILYHDINGSARMRAFALPEVRAVPASLLRSLLIRDGHSDADVAIAVTADACDKRELRVFTTDRAYPFEYMSAAISLFSAEGKEFSDGKYTVRFLDGLHEFQLIGERIVFLPIKEPLS